MKNYNLGYEKRRLERAFNKQKLTVHTTYHQFNTFFQVALENENLEEFKDSLSQLVKLYPYHLVAHRFVALTNKHLGNIEEATKSYEKVMELFKPEKSGRSAQLILKEIILYATEIRDYSLHSKATKILDDLLKQQIDQSLANMKEKLDGLEKSTKDLSRELILRESNSSDKEEMLKDANRLYSASDFKKSVNKFLEYEKKFGYPGPEFSMWIINAARPIKDFNTIIKYAKKGLFSHDLTYKQHKNILTLVLPVLKRRKDWKMMKELIEDYFNTHPNRPQQLILKRYVVCQSKLSDFDGCVAALSLFLSIWPANKSMKRFRKKLVTSIKDDNVRKKVSDELYPIIIGRDKLIIDDSSKHKFYAIGSDIRDEIEADIKEELEVDIQDEIEADIKNELDIRSEIEADIKHDLDIRSEIEADIKHDLELSAIATSERKVYAELKDASIDSYKDHFRKSYKTLLITKFADENPEELEDELEEEFEIKLKESRAYSISQMLLADVKMHVFQDPKLVDNESTLSVAEDLLRAADKKLLHAIDEGIPMYPLYNQYLEAAKAYSELSDKEFDERFYQRALGRYASSRGSFFFEQFKRQILSNKDIERDELQRFKDSASSYYREALRLRLDIGEKNTMNPGYQIAEEVVQNYLRLNVILFLYDQGVRIKNYHFKSDFRDTVKHLKKKGSMGLNILAETYLNIGSANQENFTQLISTGAYTDKHKGFLKKHPRLVFIENSDSLTEEIEKIIGKKFEGSITQKLKFFFEEVSATRYESMNAQLERISEFPLTHTSLKQIKDKINIILDEPDVLVLTKTDIDIIMKMVKVLNIYEPFLNVTPEERPIIIKQLLKETKKMNNDCINHPTYWNRVHLLSIIEKWKNEVKIQEEARLEHKLPKISISIDPEIILISKEGADINVEISNYGASPAEVPKCLLSLEYGDNQMESDIEFSKELLKPGMKDNVTFEFEPGHVTLLKDSLFKCTITIQYNYLNQPKKCSEDFTLPVIKEINPLSLSDIPWSPSDKVSEKMFKGRGRLLDQLEKHYLSKDRIESYILYGLTRHGKTSINNYIGKRLLGKKIEQRGKKLTLLTFDWNFDDAAQSVDVRDMWSYLVKSTIIKRLNEYCDRGIIPKAILNDDDFKKIATKDDRNFRAIDLTNILTLLKDYNYFAFVAIDEFTYYTDMIDLKLITPAFIASIRGLSLDEELACFIYAGVYDIVDIMKGKKYGITSQLSNAIEQQVAEIDNKSAEELIQVMGEKLKFSDKAVKYIQRVTNNIPYFIQMICKECGKFAVRKKKNRLGEIEVEKIVKYMTGEEKDLIEGEYKIRPLGENRFAGAQFRPGEDWENALISTIASASITDNEVRHNPDDISEFDLFQIWGQYGLELTKDQTYIGKIRKNIEMLQKRGVVTTTKGEISLFYQLSVDLFRRWWNVQHPNLNHELEKLVDKDNS